MVEQTVSTFGRLDAAFNNAGYKSNRGARDASGEEIDRVNGSSSRCLQLHKYELIQMRKQEAVAS